MANGFIGLALGLTHGLAPGHGWAIAASYALDKPSKWFYGATSSLILGIGHLISSIAMVVVYLWAISYFGLTQMGWMNYVAGALLIALGIWQYFNGHSYTGDDSKRAPIQQITTAQTIDTATRMTTATTTPTTPATRTETRRREDGPLNSGG